MIELLIASQLNFGNIDTKYIYQTQKPSVYAQASSGVANKDKNIEKILSAYKNLILKPKVGKNAIKMALDFYNDIIKDKKEPYVAEAYLYSGLILTTLDPKNEKEGFRRMKKAFAVGNQETRLDAAWYLGRLGFEYGGTPDDVISSEEVISYLNYVKRQTTKDRAKEIERILELMSLQKPK